MAPMAWLKDTGMKRRDTLPSTTVKQKMSASREILYSCCRDLMGCTETRRDAASV